MNNKILDEIIDLFCIVEDDDTCVCGMDTELFTNRQKAREALLDIFNRHGIGQKEYFDE
jgi:hypothetical protein